jgi:prolyl oligopeptidase
MRVRRSFFLFSTLAAVLFIAGPAGLEAQPASGFSPPAPPIAPVRPVVDDYYGTKISDPYRYMEDLKDPEVQGWLKSQNDYTHAMLAGIPGRAKLLARMMELTESVARVGFVQRLPGDLYFYRKLLAHENVPKLYMRQGLNGPEKLLLDPERITLAGTNRSKGKNTIGDVYPSDDARYAAIDIVPGGSELDTEIHVIETVSAHETGDKIARASGASWLPGSQSFIYSRLWETLDDLEKLQKLPTGTPATETFKKGRSYLHVLGTDPSKDPPVFGDAAGSSIHVELQHMYINTQPESKYAYGIVNNGSARNRSFYLAPVNTVGTSNFVWRKVADFSDDVQSIAIHGDDLYLLTFKKALRYKIVRMDARKPDLSSAETVVPPGEPVITNMAAAQDSLYVRVLDGGVSRVLRVPYGANPEVERVTLPFEGTAALAATDPRVPGTLLIMQSWTKGRKIYAYDPQTKEVSDTILQPAGRYDDPVGVEAVEVKAPSYDGTLVPLSIVRPKGMKLDGSNWTELTGYGAYGTSQNAVMDHLTIAMSEMGGVYAVCHVRGGGEYGEEWHLAGKGPTKPNTWRDFIACAEYLIEHKYTSPARLAGRGVSAGGILIGRAITERPDLFGAAVIEVGPADTLRAEIVNPGSIQEFGSTKTEEGFKVLFAMSAYHHVRDQTAYPATLLTTGMNDPRVGPWESAKMAARLQAATSSSKPILLRVEYEAGHGANTEQQYLEQAADTWSFLLWQFGVPEFQPQGR